MFKCTRLTRSGKSKKTDTMAERKTYKMINNDLQNTTQKTRNLATRTLKEIESERMCSGRLN